jgi:alpha/beta superfamily hydrolase
MQTLISEEIVQFQGGGGSISGVMAYPTTGNPHVGILLCSPHPNFAGNMENNVILGLARTLAQSALTLRFDFRGVGASSIRLSDNDSVYDFWNRVEETQEYSAPLEDTYSAFDYLADCAGDIPLFVAGYSFGCIAGLIHLHSDARLVAGVGIAPPLTQYGFDFLKTLVRPCKLFSGTDDFVFSATAWDALKTTTPNHVEYETLTGHDHFFRGDEAMLSRLVAGYFKLPIPKEGTDE